LAEQTAAIAGRSYLRTKKNWRSPAGPLHPATAVEKTSPAVNKGCAGGGGHVRLVGVHDSEQVFLVGVSQGEGEFCRSDFDRDYFSALVASKGANVVAIDQDPEVVGALWRRAAAENLTILPLVVNLARPTPAVGWRNEECPSFLDRTRGAFDTVLMLAVLHHMLVVEQIPLEAILELVAQLTSEYLLIEFVSPEDPMFRRLVRGRAELFAHLSKELFESTARRWFEIVRAEDLLATRSIYLLRKRTGDSHA